MLKNALFCEKGGKISTALGAPPSNLRWPSASNLLFPFNLHMIFLHCADFSISLKLKLRPIIMHELQLVSPLAKPAPLGSNL